LRWAVRKSGCAPASTAAETAEPRAQAWLEPENKHDAAGDIGVDLHQQRIFLGDAAGADDAVDRHAVIP